jgi:SNF2 family DNA or RNA helicase
MAILWQPHDYQKKAVKFMIQHACAGLFLDPGLGKSSITLAAFEVLRMKGLAKRMLVIAPLRPAYAVWPAEGQKWHEFSELKINVIHGPHKAERLAEQADVDVINPEGLSWLFAQKLRRHGSDPWPWDILVVDESTRFKHADTIRFKKLKPYLPMFKRRYILTGSPAPNGLLDLFGQVFLLDLGASLGRFITHYRNTYFNSTGYGGFTWTPRQGSQDAIYEKLKPLVLRMSAEDYLDLPPLIMNEVKMFLPDKARKIYDQMEAQLLAAVDNNLIVAANAAAASGKCRQIANGGIYDEAHKVTDIHEAKLDAVEEIIESLQGKPALVAYEYQHDLARLRGRFGADVPYIGGGVSPSRFREIEGAWNRGDLPLLFAQPQSVAHGLNLQGTEGTVIWHSLTWNLEDYEQFIRRVWRQGQKHKVIVHHIVADKTVDEVIMKTLKAKDKTQQRLLGALKDYAKDRRKGR